MYGLGLLFNFAERDLRGGASSIKFRPTHNEKVFDHFFEHSAV
jgi:hypothetical protein